MDPRLRWAGGAAAVAIFAIMAGSVAPASAQTSSSPTTTTPAVTAVPTTIAPPTTATTAKPAARAAAVPATFDGLCWMGPNRPIFRIRNTDATRRLDYTVRSGTATRSGALEAGTGAASTAYVVGAGKFPTANPTTLTWTTPNQSGTVDAPATPGQYCTYDVTPEVRWRTADGQPLTPPASVSGLVVTFSGPVEQLFCGWRSTTLDCTQQALTSSPLVPGSYPAARDQLQVPAFATRGAAPGYVVKVTAPAGFVLGGGTGTFALDDVGAGLGQGNVDRRMASLLGGGRSRRHVVILQQVAPAATAAPTTAAPAPAPEGTSVPTAVPGAGAGGAGGGQQVPPVTTAAPNQAPAAPAPGAPTAPAPSAAAPAPVVDPNTPLPRTGTVAPGILLGGGVIVAVGAALLFLGRRRTSPHAAR